MPKYAYDPAKAKALLKEAGFPDGFEFDLYAYRDREYTEAVIGDLAKVGIKPKLNYVQYTAFLENVRKGRTPVAHGTWGSNSVPDVSAMTAHFFLHGPDDLTKDPEVKKLIDGGRRRSPIPTSARPPGRRRSPASPRRPTGCRSSPTPSTTPSPRTSTSSRPPTRSRSSSRRNGNEQGRRSDPLPAARSTSRDVGGEGV